MILGWPSDEWPPVECGPSKIRDLEYCPTVSVTYHGQFCLFSTMCDVTLRHVIAHSTRRAGATFCLHFTHWRRLHGVYKPISAKLIQKIEYTTTSYIAILIIISLNNCGFFSTFSTFSTFKLFFGKIDVENVESVHGITPIIRHSMMHVGN